MESLLLTQKVFKTLPGVSIMKLTAKQSANANVTLHQIPGLHGNLFLKQLG
jgi:hypothetical protein